MIMKHICDMNKRQQVFHCKNIVALTNIFSATFKMVYLTENRQRKHNKLLDRPFTTIILKVTNLFNEEYNIVLYCIVLKKPITCKVFYPRLFSRAFVYIYTIISNNGHSKYQLG